MSISFGHFPWPRSLAELPSLAARSQDLGGQRRGVRESHGTRGRQPWWFSSNPDANHGAGNYPLVN